MYDMSNIKITLTDYHREQLEIIKGKMHASSLGETIRRLIDDGVTYYNPPVIEKRPVGRPPRIKATPEDFGYIPVARINILEGLSEDDATLFDEMYNVDKHKWRIDDLFTPAAMGHEMYADFVNEWSAEQDSTGQDNVRDRWALKIWQDKYSPEVAG